MKHRFADDDLDEYDAMDTADYVEAWFQRVSSRDGMLDSYNAYVI